MFTIADKEARQRDKRIRGRLWQILTRCAPSHYSQQISQVMADEGIVPQQALLFPLTCPMEKQLLSLPHHLSAECRVPRDNRLCAWFQTCEGLGADARAALRVGERNACQLGRLVRLRAHDSLAWWHARGADGCIVETGTLGGESTTLATLAFLLGQHEVVERLMPVSPLTHSDHLWRALWSRQNGSDVSRLMQALWSAGHPPDDALWALSKAPVNLKNIQPLLAAAGELVRGGIDPSFTPAGQAPALVMAIRHSQSSATVPLVQFFLDGWCDPLERVNAARDHPLAKLNGMTPLEVALHRWTSSSAASHARPVLMDCFEAMARRCGRGPLNALFPPETLDRLVREQSELVKGVPGPGNGQRSPARDLARLQALLLELNTDEACAVARPRGPRL